MRKLTSLFLSMAVGPVVLARPQDAHAGDGTIKQPGDHPMYKVEFEPHGLLGWEGPGYGGYTAGTGFGLGARLSIPVWESPIKTLNNTIAIGIGLDWIHYSADCYAYPTALGGCYSYFSDVNRFLLPVVAQWNFYVAKNWSVFGEPGLALYHDFYSCNQPPGTPAGYGCGVYGSTTGVLPVFYVGGRYHFNEHVTLTMRVGYPTISVGASFM